MRIGILGGTGTLGEGLCLRLGRATDHELAVGSRDPERARAAAADYRGRLAGDGDGHSGGGDPPIEGADNEAAVAGADVVVLSVPPKYARRTVEDLAAELAPGTVLVSPAVPMSRDESGFRHDPPRTAPSLLELVARAAPAATSVVGAYHALPASRLADLDGELEYDVPVVGNDPGAVAGVCELTDAIEGLRALAAGGLGAAATVESLTPLLLNLADGSDLHDVGPCFH